MTARERVRPAASPPLGSVPRFLWWQASLQPGLLAGGVVFGTLWTLCQVVWPWLLGRAIDEGITGDARAVLWWCAALLGVVAVQAVATSLRHRMATLNWLRASTNVARLIGHHTASTGRATTADMPGGEILASVTNDAQRIGEMYDNTARLSGGLVAYVVVGTLLLQQSPSLGLVAILGVPLLGAVMVVFVPTLQARQFDWRRESGRLTTLGADTVAGLRVLRGIGGEDVFVERYAEQSQATRRAGIRVARVQSWLDGLNVLLPGLLVATFLSTGARFVIAGELSPGQFVTLYGYATFLILPLRTSIEAVQSFSRGAVATRRVLDVLRITPQVSDAADPVAAPPHGVDLVDVASGVVIPAGKFIALVDANPDNAGAIAVRLGRFDDATHAQAPVLWGTIEHTRVPISELRRRIVVSDATPHLFTGALIDGLDIRAIDRIETSAEERQRRVEAALGAVAAMETVEALPGGLHESIPERGRTLSGGQRQRLSLARALLTEAEVLILVEPTSAVDAHTEALVADGIRQLRRGRTTVIVTESPLVLDRADLVHVLEEGRLVGSGTHATLLHRADAVGRLYRSVVARGTPTASQPLPGDGLTIQDPPGGADALPPGLRPDREGDTHGPTTETPGQEGGEDAPSHR